MSRGVGVFDDLLAMKVISIMDVVNESIEVSRGAKAIRLEMAA